MDSITNKLKDLHHDVDRRDAVAFRMHLHELARRGLYDAEIDALTIGTWSAGFDDVVWKLVKERLKAISNSYDSDWRAR